MGRPKSTETLDQLCASLLDGAVRDANGCLIPTRGSRKKRGYRWVYAPMLPSKYAAAHRIVYAYVKGPIPDGMTIDHLCHNQALTAGTCKGGDSDCPHRECIDPEHLEAVPNAVNIARSDQSLATCKWGHPWTEENTGRQAKNGLRYCKTCNRIRANARYHRVGKYERAAERASRRAE